MVGCLHSHQICLVPIVGEAPELRTLLILTGLNVSCTAGGSTRKHLCYWVVEHQK